MFGAALVCRWSDQRRSLIWRRRSTRAIGSASSDMRKHYFLNWRFLRRNRNELCDHNYWNEFEAEWNNNNPLWGQAAVGCYNLGGDFLYKDLGMPNQHWLYNSVHKTWINEHSGDIIGLEDFNVDANVHTYVKDDDTSNLKWAIEYCEDDHDHLHWLDYIKIYIFKRIITFSNINNLRVNNIFLIFRLTNFIEYIQMNSNQWYLNIIIVWYSH